MPITESASGGSEAAENAATARWFQNVARLLRDGGVLAMPGLHCTYEVWPSRQTIRLAEGPRPTRFENIVRGIPGWTVED